MTLALPLVGCGESEESSSSARGVAIEKLPSKVATLVCAKAFECCTETERSADFFLGELATQQECTDGYTALMALGIGKIVDAENAGRLRYDPDAAADCVAQMQAASCAEYQQIQKSESCSLGIVPLVAEGGACDDNNQCVKGRCIGDSDDQDGKCDASRGEGASCESNDDCDSERCSFDTGAGTCTPKSAEGVPCDYANECESGVCDDDVCVGSVTQCTL